MSPGLGHILRRHTALGNPTHDQKNGKGLYAIHERRSEGDVSSAATGDASSSGRSWSREKPRSTSQGKRRPKNPFLDDEEEDESDSPPSSREKGAYPPTLHDANGQNSRVKFMDLKGPAPFASAQDEYDVMVEEYEEEIQRLEKVNATLTANVSTLTAAALDSDADGASTAASHSVKVIEVERCRGCGLESCSEMDDGSIGFMSRASSRHVAMDITPNELYTPLNNDIYNDMILTEEHYLHQIAKLQKSNAKLQRKVEHKKKLVSQLSMNLKTAAEKITEVGKEKEKWKTKAEKQKGSKSQPPVNDHSNIEQIHQYQVQVLENELQSLKNLVGQRAKVHERHRQSLLEEYRRDDAVWNKRMERPEDTLARVMRRLRREEGGDDGRTPPVASEAPTRVNRTEAKQDKPGGISVLDSVTSLFGGSSRQKPQQQQQRQSSFLRKERVQIDEHPLSGEIKSFDKRNLRVATADSSNDSDESSSESSSDSGSESEDSESEEEDSDSVESRGRLAMSSPVSSGTVAKATQEDGGLSGPIGGGGGDAEYEDLKKRIFGRNRLGEGSKSVDSGSPMPGPKDVDSNDENADAERTDSGPPTSQGVIEEHQNPSHLGDVFLDSDYDEVAAEDSASPPPSPTEHSEEQDGDKMFTQEVEDSKSQLEADSCDSDPATGTDLVEGSRDTSDGSVDKAPALASMDGDGLVDEASPAESTADSSNSDSIREDNKSLPSDVEDMSDNDSVTESIEEVNTSLPSGNEAGDLKLPREFHQDASSASKDQLPEETDRSPEEENSAGKKELHCATTDVGESSISDVVEQSHDHGIDDGSPPHTANHDDVLEGTVGVADGEDDINTQDGYTAKEAKDDEDESVPEFDRDADDSEDEYHPKEGKDDDGEHSDDDDEQDQETDKVTDANALGAVGGEGILENDHSGMNAQEDIEGGKKLLVETKQESAPDKQAPSLSHGTTEDPAPSHKSTSGDGPSSSTDPTTKLSKTSQEERSIPSLIDLGSTKSHSGTIVSSGTAITDATQARISAALELKYNSANQSLADTLGMIQEQTKARMDGDEDRSPYHNILSQFDRPASKKKDALCNRLSRRQLFQSQQGLLPTDLSVGDLSTDDVLKQEDWRVLVTSQDIDKYQVPRYHPPVLPPNSRSSAPTFKKGLKDGYYVYKSSSGNEYTGHWKDGKRDGYGRAKYRDGEVYNGEWRRGRREGHGV